MNEFFNPKKIGSRLKEVAVDYIENDSKGTRLAASVLSRWYHSDPDTDLFIWMDDAKNIIKQQLVFRGQVVEWNCLDGMKTGYVIEQEMENKKPKTDQNEPAMPRSESIQFDKATMGPSVQQALAIIEHLDDDSLKAQLFANFNNPQNIQTMSPEEFVKRFGQSLNTVKTNPIKNLVKKIKKLL